MFFCFCFFFFSLHSNEEFFISIAIWHPYFVNTKIAMRLLSCKRMEIKIICLVLTIKIEWERERAYSCYELWSQKFIHWFKMELYVITTRHSVHSTAPQLRVCHFNWNIQKWNVCKWNEKLQKYNLPHMLCVIAKCVQRMKRKFKKIFIISSILRFWWLVTQSWNEVSFFICTRILKKTPILSNSYI